MKDFVDLEWHTASEVSGAVFFSVSLELRRSALDPGQNVALEATVQRSLYVPPKKGLRKVLACVLSAKADVAWLSATGSPPKIKGHLHQGE